MAVVVVRGPLISIFSQGRGGKTTPPALSQSPPEGERLKVLPLRGSGLGVAPAPGVGESRIAGRKSRELPTRIEGRGDYVSQSAICSLTRALALRRRRGAGAGTPPV